MRNWRLFWSIPYAKEQYEVLERALKHNASAQQLQDFKTKFKISVIISSGDEIKDEAAKLLTNHAVAKITASLGRSL